MDIEKRIEIALELGDVNETMKQEMIENVKSIIEHRLILAIDELLTDEQRTEFENVQQTQDTVAARLWLEKNVVNTQALYSSLLDDYLAEKRNQ